MDVPQLQAVSLVFFFSTFFLDNLEIKSHISGALSHIFPPQIQTSETLMSSIVGGNNCMQVKSLPPTVDSNFVPLQMHNIEHNTIQTSKLTTLVASLGDSRCTL